MSIHNILNRNFYVLENETNKIYHINLYKFIDFFYKIPDDALSPNNDLLRIKKFLKTTSDSKKVKENFSDVLFYYVTNLVYKENPYTINLISSLYRLNEESFFIDTSKKVNKNYDDADLLFYIPKNSMLEEFYNNFNESRFEEMLGLDSKNLEDKINEFNEQFGEDESEEELNENEDAMQDTPSIDMNIFSYHLSKEKIKAINTHIHIMLKHKSYFGVSNNFVIAEEIKREKIILDSLFGVFYKFKADKETDEMEGFMSPIISKFYHFLFGKFAKLEHYTDFIESIFNIEPLYEKEDIKIDTLECIKIQFEYGKKLNLPYLFLTKTYFFGDVLIMESASFSKNIKTKFKECGVNFYYSKQNEYLTNFVLFLFESILPRLEAIQMEFISGYKYVENTKLEYEYILHYIDKYIEVLTIGDVLIMDFVETKKFYNDNYLSSVSNVNDFMKKYLGIYIY
jgi:hypothetical protein